MTDMTAFERQLSGEIAGLMGPVRPVDDGAIFTAITTTQSPRWRFQSMFRATKFVIAGAILALFGGFLLSGVLTQQPSDDRLPAVGASASATAQAEATDAVTSEPEPTSEVELDGTTTSPDLLPGVDLVTEEVEPGVYRALSDGAGHDLVAEPPAGVTVGADGSVWLLRTSPESDLWTDALLELGEQGVHLLEPAESGHNWVDLAGDADGSAWLTMAPEPAGAGLGSLQGDLTAFDGTAWATPAWPDGSSSVGAIEATSDGVVWVTRHVTNGAGPSVARIMDGAWTELPTLDDSELEGQFRSRDANFAAAPDGTAWLANGRLTGGDIDAPDPGPIGLLHFDGERWAVADLPSEVQGLHAGPLALGPDGTLWVYLARDSEPGETYLARLDADGWTVFPEADGVPLLAGWIYYEARMAVDAEGRLWIAFGGDGGQPAPGDSSWALPSTLAPTTGMVGLLSFDGDTWSQYLSGLHVNRVDITNDGVVLATALSACSDDCEYDNRDQGVAGLYVITPEAVAAAD